MLVKHRDYQYGTERYGTGTTYHVPLPVRNLREMWKSGEEKKFAAWIGKNWKAQPYGVRQVITWKTHLKRWRVSLLNMTSSSSFSTSSCWRCFTVPRYISRVTSYNVNDSFFYSTVFYRWAEDPPTVAQNNNNNIGSVSDPDSLSPVPDPAYRSGSGSNPEPGFWWPKLEKHYSWKNFFIKNRNLLIPRPPSRTS